MDVLSMVRDAAKKEMSSLADSMTGKLEKAQITFIDNMQIAEKDKKKILELRAKKAPSYSLSGATAISDRILKKHGGKLTLLRKTDGQRRRSMTVQFNPASIQMTAYGGGLVDKKVEIERDGKKDDFATRAKGRIDFSVQLVFDASDPMRDFGAGNMSAMGAVEYGTKQLTGLVMGKDADVQTRVEGFLAAIGNSSRRSMEFAWGEMLYRGQLNTVNAAYTMFSPEGKPVRAIVQLSMVCAEEEISVYGSGEWLDYYRRAFLEYGADGASATELTGNQSLEKKFGSLLQL